MRPNRGNLPCRDRYRGRILPFPLSQSGVGVGETTL
jgi:hypothetical protein